MERDSLEKEKRRVERAKDRISIEKEKFETDKKKYDPPRPFQGFVLPESGSMIFSESKFHPQLLPPLPMGRSPPKPSSLLSSSISEDHRVLKDLNKQSQENIENVVPQPVLTQRFDDYMRSRTYRANNPPVSRMRANSEPNIIVPKGRSITNIRSAKKFRKELTLPKRSPSDTAVKMDGDLLDICKQLCLSKEGGTDRSLVHLLSSLQKLTRIINNFQKVITAVKGKEIPTIEQEFCMLGIQGLVTAQKEINVCITHNFRENSVTCIANKLTENIKNIGGIVKTIMHQNPADLSLMDELQENFHVLSNMPAEILIAIKSAQRDREIEI